MKRFLSRITYLLDAMTGFLEECLDLMGVPKGISYDSLSYTEQLRFKICNELDSDGYVEVNLRYFDRATRERVLEALSMLAKKYGVDYDVV